MQPVDSQGNTLIFTVMDYAYDCVSEVGPGAMADPVYFANVLRAEGVLLSSDGHEAEHRSLPVMTGEIRMIRNMIRTLQNLPADRVWERRLESPDQSWDLLCEARAGHCVLTFGFSQPLAHRKFFSAEVTQEELSSIEREFSAVAESFPRRWID